MPAFLGVVILLLGVGLAFAPIGGRNADLWTPITTAFWFRRLSAGRHWRNDAMRLGHVDGEPPWPTLPGHLAGLRILDVTADAAAPMGVVRNGTTYTAVLSVRPEAFALCDSTEQARRPAGWGGILSGVAREASPIVRLQWIERTAPADESELIRTAQRHLTLPDDHRVAQGYLDLLAEAGPTTQSHETYLAVQIDRKRAARLIRSAGGGDDGAIAVLRRELATLISNLAGADVTVTGILTARQRSKRSAWPTTPVPVPRSAAAALSTPTTPVSHPLPPGRRSSKEDWSWLRADDAYHATFWVEEWSRIPVRPDFLSPLLLGSRATRTVSLTVESVPPGRAARQVEAARTAAPGRRCRPPGGGAGRRPRRLPLLRLRHRLRPQPRRPRRRLW